MKESTLTLTLSGDNLTSGYFFQNAPLKGVFADFAMLINETQPTMKAIVKKKISDDIRHLDSPGDTL